MAKKVQKTHAVLFPFDLFGSQGSGRGVEALHHFLKAMLAEGKNRISRASSYAKHVRISKFGFQTISAYKDWRSLGREVARKSLCQNEFLFWVSGNHLGVLPIYDELARTRTLIIQLDAHLDVYNFGNFPKDPTSGNFLLHVKGRLPDIVSVGSREVLLKPKYAAKFFLDVYTIEDLASDFEKVIEHLLDYCARAKQVFLDIDCDVLDQAFFPAVRYPAPFGITPQQLLRIVDLTLQRNLIGVAVSEFSPTKDGDEQSIALLGWLMKHILQAKYEG